MNIVRNEIRDLRSIIFEKDNIISAERKALAQKDKAHQSALAEIAELRRMLGVANK